MAIDSASTDTPEINAEAHSDDYVFEVPFLANEWFTSATPAQICNLVDCDWGGDAAADCIALELTEANEEIQRLFDYLSLKNSDRNRRESTGFEVHVEEDQAREWLRIHRPDILSLPALKRYQQLAS